MNDVVYLHCRLCDDSTDTASVKAVAIQPRMLPRHGALVLHQPCTVVDPLHGTFGIEG